jgi:hypothetical protein
MGTSKKAHTGPSGSAQDSASATVNPGSWRAIEALIDCRNQTDSVGVDLHYRRLDADGVAFSSAPNCGLLRGPELELPFRNLEIPAAVGQLQTVRAAAQVA